MADYDVQRSKRPGFNQLPDWMQKKILEDEAMHSGGVKSIIPLPDQPPGSVSPWEAMPARADMDKEAARGAIKGFFGE